MKITVSGAIGSGKSTVSKLLAKKLKYNYYSIGKIMRELAKEKGISLHKLSAQAEKNPSIDKELDKRQIEIGKKEDNFVMDSRIGFHFIPDSFKIFLDVDIPTAAKRILNEKRGDEVYKTLDEAILFIKKRAESETVRYKKYYKIDFPNRKYFDLIINTSSKTANEVSFEILSILKP